MPKENQRQEEQKSKILPQLFTLWVDQAYWQVSYWRGVDKKYSMSTQVPQVP